MASKIQSLLQSTINNKLTYVIILVCNFVIIPINTNQIVEPMKLVALLFFCFFVIRNG